MNKILIYRKIKDNKIICIDECPPYDKKKLDAIIEEFNLTDKNNSVEVKQIKENSLEDYLITNFYKSNPTKADEVKAILDNLFFNAKRLSNYFDVLYTDYTQKMNKIK